MVHRTKKTDAGKPHVRLEEGDVASVATPKRGGLLYKHVLRRAVALVAAFAMGIAVHAAPPPTASQTYYGLLVGVNYYSNGTSSLSGCDRDVVNMRDAYTANGFCSNENTTVFLDYDATKAAVRAKFNEIASVAKSGDTVLFYQSSHGGDYDGDKGSFLCMTDDDWYDTEFAEDLLKFADGVKVVVVIDACHSGGMFKAAGVSARTMLRKRGFNFAARVQRHMKARISVRKGAASKSDGASVGWITACDWDELSTASSFGSIFTNAIVDGWRDGSADVDSDGYVSFSELADYAVANVDYDKYGQTTQVDNDGLLSNILAGRVYDMSVSRPLVFDKTFYGIVGICPASVTIPAGVERIAESSFDADYNDVGALESVTIPASVTEIGDYAFYECASLATVTFEGDRNAVSMGVDVFYGTPYFETLPFRLLIDDGWLYGFEGAVPSEIVIPDMVWGIAESVFDADYYDVEALTSVTIPASVEEIGRYAFYGCENLATVTFDGDIGDIWFASGITSTFWGTPWLDDNYPAPDNDYFESAQVISGISGSVTGCTVNSSSEDGEPLYDYGESAYTVWFRWVAETNCTVTFDTNGSTFDTVIGVYTGDAVDKLEVIGENDDYDDVASAVSFDAAAGGVYYVAVGGYEFQDGNVTLSWSVGGLPEPELEWYTSRDDAVNAAQAAGLRILLVSGRDTCSNTAYLRETACYDPDVMEILQEDFVLWYNNCDEHGDEVLDYTDGLGSYTLPLVCALDPYDMDTYIDRSTGFMDESALYDFLTDLPDWEPTRFRLEIDDGWVFGYAGEIPDGEYVDLEIPDGVEGIEDGAFAGLVGLRSVYIPASVTYIGESAFADCSDLEEIIFEERESEQVAREWTDEDGSAYSGSYVGFDSPLEIGSYAFAGCEALTYLEVPAHVGYVGEYAFEDCTSLEEVCFLADDSVTESGLNIKTGAFSGCEALASVSFEDRPWDLENEVYNYIDIGEDAFYGCEALTDLYLGEGVEEVEAYAFYGVGIDSLEVPASCYYIGEYAFADCENLADVYFVGYVGYDIEIDEGAFEGTPFNNMPPANDNFANAQAIAGVSGIVSGRNSKAMVEEGESHLCDPTATVWYKWTPEVSGTVMFGLHSSYDAIIGVYDGTAVGSLKSVAFNDDVEFDGYSSALAFEAVKGATYYIMVGGYVSDEGLFSLDWMPYEYDVTFEIEDGVLKGFSYNGIEPSILTIPEGVTAIDDWVFEEHDGIVALNLPSSLKSIGETAFAWTGIETVNGLRDDIEVGKQAFWRTPFDETRPFGLDIVKNCVVGFHGSPCTTEIVIPEGVTNIAAYAFDYWDYERYYELYDAETGDWYEEYYCSLTNLHSVTIPASVASIGKWAFEDCADLVSVTIENPEILIDGSAFCGCEQIALNVATKVGHTLVGWELFREKNPGRWVDEWDDEGNYIGQHLEEYEPDFMPTGTVVRIDSIEPLIYGMATGEVRTNYVGEVYAVTNNLYDVWATPAWEGNRYTVAFDANGGEGTMASQTCVYDAEQSLSACAFTRSAHEFVGWALTSGSDDVAYLDGAKVLNMTAAAGGKVTLYAVWERSTLWAPVAIDDDPSGGGSSGGAEQGDEMFDGAAAETYDGYVYTEDGILKGTIQVKAAKAKLNRKTGKTVSKITVVIQLAGEKKVTAKGDLDLATVKFEATAGGRALSLAIGANGVTGRYGAYYIDGAQNKFTSKDASDKQEGAAALARWQGVYTLARRDADGWSGFSLTVAAKGKVKVQGVLADGTKVSATSQLLVGEGGVCAIPVVIAKKANVAFNVWLSDDGVEVVGLDGEVVVGKLASLKAGAQFSLDVEAFSALLGDGAYAKYLPDGLAVAQNGTKWVVAGGAKAGKVQLAKDGTVDEAKAGDNASALKFTYTAKTGTFKGSFKAYTQVNGKPKGVTVNVAGVLVDGIGYGSATIKKVGSVPVTVE